MQTKDSQTRSLQHLDETQLSTVHKAELEKQISHQSPVIHEVILENLQKLSDDTLLTNLKDICQLLIDLTLCSDSNVR